MPITWRNLGQSSNSGNALIAGASDTITSGINSIQAAAQSVTDEQNRQYNTQADINTANILSDINRLDQDGVDSFDVASLNNEFGSQFDATGIADALDGRVNALRDIAQQEADNANRDEITDSRLATDALNRKNLTGQIGAREDAKKKLDKYNTFNRGVSKDIGSYNNIDHLKTEITKAGQKANMETDEIQSAINSATTTFNNNIALTGEQQNQLLQRGAEQAQIVSQAVAFQNNALDTQARQRGIIPELAELSSVPDTKENSMEALNKTYGGLIANAGLGEEASVAAFNTLLTNAFDKEGLPPPNNAELEYFLKFGFEEAEVFGSDGLDFDNIDGQLQRYLKMKGNPELDSYNLAKRNIQQGAIKTAKAQAKDLARYGRMMVNDRRVDFTGQGQRFDSIIPAQVDRSKLDKSLLSTEWFDGIVRPLDTSNKTRAQNRSQR